jgi:phosphoribosylglycinamide formyltransferase-1
MKISFLASHGGSAAIQIIEAIRSNDINAEIGIVVTNNKNSKIYTWCIENKVKVAHLSGKTHPDEKEKDKKIFQALSDAKTDLVVLSGYMKKIGQITLSKYNNKILNIHPSLLPKHGGKGFYGDKVHESVLKSGDKESGATVHFINEEYDEGPIILQKKIALSDSETVETLRNKIQAIEGQLYLESIKKLMKA